MILGKTNRNRLNQTKHTYTLIHTHLDYYATSFKGYVHFKKTNNKTGHHEKWKDQRTTRGSWKLNTAVDKIKISSEGLNNRLGMTEDHILEDKIEEIAQYLEQKMETENMKEVIHGRYLQEVQHSYIKFHNTSRDSTKW